MKMLPRIFQVYYKSYLLIEIQEAYETLSDVNQRTWYDNNRERILCGKDNMTKEE